MAEMTYKSRIISVLELMTRVAFILLALWALTTGSLAGVACASIGAIFSRKKTRDKYLPRECECLSGRRLIIAAIAIFVLTFSFSTYSNTQAEAEKAETDKLKIIEADRIAARKAHDFEKLKKSEALAIQRQTERNNAFMATKESVLANARALLSKGDIKGANKSLESFSVSDPDLEATKQEIEIAQINSQIHGEESLSTNELSSLYGRLMELEPKNKSTSAKYAKILKQIAEQKEQAEVSSAITKQIENQFSGWDGSHIRVVRAIKARMNDPDSYKHVETTYVRQARGLQVRTVYRGKNSFGAVIIAVSIAQTDPNGNVVSLTSER